MATTTQRQQTANARTHSWPATAATAAQTTPYQQPPKADAATPHQPIHDGHLPPHNTNTQTCTGLTLLCVLFSLSPGSLSSLLTPRVGQPHHKSCPSSNSLGRVSGTYPTSINSCVDMLPAMSLSTLISTWRVCPMFVCVRDACEGRQAGRQSSTSGGSANSKHNFPTNSTATTPNHQQHQKAPAHGKGRICRSVQVVSPQHFQTDSACLPVRVLHTCLPSSTQQHNTVCPASLHKNCKRPERYQQLGALCVPGL